jgi:hypothetical protein
VSLSQKGNLILTTRKSNGAAARYPALGTPRTPCVLRGWMEKGILVIYEYKDVWTSLEIGNIVQYKIKDRVA